MSDIDTVALLIGDTSHAILGTADIQTFLDSRVAIDSTGGTVYNVVAAAADAAGAIAAQYASQFNFSEDGQTFQVAQRVGHYQALEQSLRARSGGSTQQLSIAGTTTT